MEGRDNLDPASGPPTLLGDFPSFSYADQLENKQERRNRTVQSCTECRRRKTKCDRVFPCGPCKTRGANARDACVEYQKPLPEGLTGYTHLRDFDTLVSRVYELECLVSAMFRGEHLTLPEHTGTGQQNAIASGSRSVRFAPGTSTEPDGDGSRSQTMRQGSFFDEPMDNINFQVDGMEETWDNTQVHPNETTQSGMVIRQPRPSFPRQGTKNSTDPVLDLSGPSMSMIPPNPQVGISPPFSTNWQQAGSLQGRSFAGPSIQNSEPVSKAPSLTEHDAALLLEDMVYDRKVMRDGNTGLPGMTSESRSTPLELSQDMTPKSIDGHAVGQERVHIPGLDRLPPLALAQYLLSHFLSDIEWLFRCLHIPSFTQRVQDFHRQFPTSGGISSDQAAFLPLYTACLCASLHLMTDEVLRNTGYNQKERDAALSDWNELLEMTLVKIDWAGSPRLESLQAFILIGPYWSSINRSESHLAQLGTAIKVAMNMGLSRLGPELAMESTSSQIAQHFGRRWTNASDREVGRRVWWALVELDWIASLEHRFDHVASIDHATCAQPANISDEALIGHGPIISEPMSTRTNMSFFLNRLSFLYPVRNFVQAVLSAGKLSYDLIISTQEGFMSVISQLSPFYRLNADFEMDPTQWATDAATLQRLSAEKQLINTHGHYQILRLHRFYLNMAYRSHKYAFSKDVTLKSASFILGTNLAQSPANGLLRYWPLAHSILSATIVILMNLCHAGPFEIDDLAFLVRRGIGSLRRLQGSAATSRSADVLQKLYDAEMRSKRDDQTSPRDYAPGKRKRLFEDPGKFGGLLKRVLTNPHTPQHPIEAGRTDYSFDNSLKSDFNPIGFNFNNLADGFSQNVDSSQSGIINAGQDAAAAIDTFDWSTILMGDSGGQDDQQFLELLRWTIPEFGDESVPSN